MEYIGCFLFMKVISVLQSFLNDFCSRFPVQFSIEVIRARLHNNYYRTLEAVQHDATVMLDNAESYFSKSSEMTKKILRLSEWIQDNLLSL
jgi:PH-interacting protein